MKNILIISQARCSSTRLPGKVLKKVLDKPLLWYLVKRVEQVKILHKFVIATGPLNLNKPIVDFAENSKINYYIGSENDVLDRYYNVAKKYHGKVIVRITSDCPLIDPDIIEKGLVIFLNGKYDYVSNIHEPTYPDGLDVEIFSFKALKTAWKYAQLQSEREHVTPYIWKNPNKFKLKNFENEKNLSNFRLTVDTPDDFLLITKIIENFQDNWSDFRTNDVIEFLKRNPELLEINSQYQRNEGFIKSLKEDKKVK